MESWFVVDEIVRSRLRADTKEDNNPELKVTHDIILNQLGMVDGTDEKCTKRFVRVIKNIFSLPYTPMNGESIW